MRALLSYPRLIALGMCIGAAYVLYNIGMFEWLDGRLDGYGYPAMFVAGLLYTYGFTTPFAIAAFVSMAPDVNPWIAAPIAGLGAYCSDLLIFELLRISFFGDELERLKRTSMVERIRRLVHHESLSDRIRTYGMWLVTIIVIGSPLPDEIGVALLSSTTKLDKRMFGVICMSMNTLGILVILLLARAAA